MSLPCIDDIRKVAEEAGGEITDAAAARILRQIEGVAKGRAADKYGGDVGKALNDMVEEHLHQKTINALIAKRGALQTIAAKNQILEYVRSPEAQGQLFGERLAAVLGGTQKKGRGNRNSIDAEINFKTKSIMSRLEADLKDSGLWKDFLSNRNWENVARELGEFGKKDSRPGITGDKSAEGLAKIIRKYQDENVAFQNLYGSMIRQRPGYAVPQSHSREALIRMGKTDTERYQNWKALILPLLDHTETFNGADPDYVLKKIYNNFITGDFTSGPESDGMNLVGGAAFKASAKRFLHFKDIDAWITYQKAMGNKTLSSQVISSLHEGARRGALMKRLGPDFEKTFMDLRQELMQQVKDSDAIENKDAQSKALKNWTLDAAFNQLTGRSELAANPDIANFQNLVSTWTSMASQGGVVLTAAPTDTVFSHLTAGLLGLGHLNLLGRHFQFLAHSAPDARKALRSFGTLADGIAGTGASRYNQYNKPGQALSKASDKFFALNLLNWWTDNTKGGFSAALLDHIGDHAGKPMHELPAELSRLLGEYDISPREWDALRSVAQTVGGRKWVTMGNLDALPDSVKEGLIKDFGAGSWKKAQEKIDSKLGMLVYDQSSHAVPTPGVNQRVWTTFGTRSGTVPGALARFTTMFTGFPMAINERIIRRSLFSENNLPFKQWLAHDWKGKVQFAGYVAMSAAAGYASMVLRDLAMGKQPRPFTNEDGTVQYGTFLDALRAGGALGMYGDFLLQDYAAHAFSSGRAGPIVSKLDPLMTAVSQVARGQAPAPGQIMKGIVSAVPGNNLFWSRHALDYLILWHLQDLIDPGSLRRVESSLQRQKNQQYYPGNGPTDYYRP